MHRSLMLAVEIAAKKVALRPPAGRVAQATAAAATQPTRNGGRHRCQPPLRRALDLPVFPEQTRKRARHQDPGAPAQASRLRTAALPCREPFPGWCPGPLSRSGSPPVPPSPPPRPCGSGLRFGCPPPGCRAPSSAKEETSHCRTSDRTLILRSPPPAVRSAALLGMTARSAAPGAPEGPTRSLRHEEDHLFRRLLPALLREAQRCSRPGNAFSADLVRSPCRRRSGVLASSSLPGSLAGLRGFRPGPLPPITPAE